jgi:hypothetical protein
VLHLTRFNECELPVRTRNMLTGSGYIFVEELAFMTGEEAGLGSKSFGIIERHLSQQGLRVGQFPGNQLYQICRTHPRETERRQALIAFFEKNSVTPGVYTIEMLRNGQVPTLTYPNQTPEGPFEPGRG